MSGIRELRRFLRVRTVALVILFALWVAIAVMAAFAARTLLGTDFSKVVAAPASLSPEARVSFEQAQLVLKALQSASTQVVVIVVAFTLALFGVVIALTDRLLRSDKVSVLGFEFEATQALRESEERADLNERAVEGLAENIREFQELDSQLNMLVREPDEDRLFEVLDLVAQTAAFTVRSASRAVRVSVWLYSKRADQLRIIAAYRVAAKTRATFTMNRSDQGFAAEVLRSNRPLVKNMDFTGSAGDWKFDPTETQGTKSILGVPIEVDDPEWAAVLCFSTNRQKDAFSLEVDRAEALYFATVASTLLALTLTAVTTSGTPVIEEFWGRYMRSEA